MSAFPNVPWDLANKAFGARGPTVGTDHVGGDGCFIDKYKASGVKQPSLADPASALPRHVVSVSLCGAQTFFNGDAMTSEKSAERAAASRNSPLVQRKTISSSVRSGCSRLSARICWAYSSNGEVLPPCGIGSHVPSSRKRCIDLMAELMAMSECSAASRRELPASTKPMTRLLSSPGYGERIA
jgi:hypothetical protein